MGNEEREMWAQVKSITFSVSLSNLKSDYAMQNISTGLFANIQFLAQEYVFQGMKYAYGTYPGADDTNRALERHKQHLIATIENAIKNYTPEN